MMLVGNMIRVRITVVIDEWRVGPTSLEAERVLTILGQCSWEEGSGHAWLLAYVGTMGPSMGLVLGALVHSSLPTQP